MAELYLPALDPDDDEQPFPPLDTATDDPNGLLAVGGSLRVPRLVNAYRHGVFPWFEAGQPILWWSPSPRMVLKPDQIHVSKSLRKLLNKNLFRVSFDQAFEHVIHACAAPRKYTDDTWITQSMQLAYIQMHQAGYAHSIEVWYDDELVGGLYGIALGQMFFGESMFSRQANASKVAMVSLSNWLKFWHYQLIDCQMETEHLSRMGAYSMSREAFEQIVIELRDQPPSDLAWHRAPTHTGISR